MRKTTILALATAALAVVTIVTDLIRADASAISGKISANQVSHVRTTGALKVENFDAI
jgi:hypothetical protein